MILKIERKDYPDHFDTWTEEPHEVSYEEHRKGKSYSTRLIFQINAKNDFDFPELWGYWETETLMGTYDWGLDDEINELTRVKKIQVVTEKWETIKSENTKN